MLQTPTASSEPADQEGALSSALTRAARPELIGKIIASAPG
jgi:hypothetical protein